MWRALRLRCTRCGGRGILRDWFHLRERCPTCGWEFEREEDFFYSAYFLNLCLVLSVLFVVCMTFLLVKSAWPSASYIPALLVAVLVAVAVPVAAYPFSKTLWLAIEMAIGEDDPIAEAEAAVYADQRHHGPEPADGSADAHDRPDRPDRSDRPDKTDEERHQRRSR